MKKLIATATKKNAERARKRLDSARVSLNIPGELAGEISATDALQEGYRLLAASKAEEAVEIANALLQQVDDVVDIYLLKARALLELEALYELQILVEQLVEAAPANHGVLMIAARYYYLAGQAEESLGWAKKISKNDPRNIEALMHMELCYRYRGKTGQAEKILDRCLVLSRPNWRKREESFKQYSSSLFRKAGYAGLDAEQKSDLDSMLKSADDPVTAMQAAYALGRQAQKTGDQQAELEYLRVANDIECSVLGLDSRLENLASIHEKDISLQRDFFEQGGLPWNPAEVVSSHAPVFVLGLPRSGTTLLEQMLGSHSDIGQVGETKAFVRALKLACRKVNPVWNCSDYPRNLDRLTEQDLSGIASSYERQQCIVTEKPIYIDKELANFQYVGLMAAIWPSAKFIHMDRAPMDIFLSCFRNSIPGVPEAANLRAIAEYYVYMKKLIGLWRKLIGERLLVVNYQALVKEPDDHARQVAAFLGVDYQPEMLQFYERKNLVRTLSVDQVRKEIYTSSIEGWRKYSDVLSPARKVLEQYDIPLDGVGYL